MSDAVGIMENLGGRAGSASQVSSRSSPRALQQWLHGHNVDRRASVTEEELKKTGVAHMGRMLLEADNHIFRLDSQLAERNKELLETQQQLALATRWLQQAADELDASKAATTAQQEQHSALLQRHQALTQQLKAAADKGAAALKLLDSAVLDRVKAAELPQGCTAGIHRAVEALKLCASLHPSSLQSPACSAPCSAQPTLRASQDEPSPRSSRRIPFYSSRQSTRPAASSLKGRPPVPPLATSFAAQLMHKPAPAAGRAATSLASDDCTCRPHRIPEVSGRQPGVQTAASSQPLQDRPPVPPSPTAVAAKLAAAEGDAPPASLGGGITASAAAAAVAEVGGPQEEQQQQCTALCTTSVFCRAPAGRLGAEEQREQELEQELAGFEEADGVIAGHTRGLKASVSSLAKGAADVKLQGSLSIRVGRLLLDSFSGAAEKQAASPLASGVASATVWLRCRAAGAGAKQAMAAASAAVLAVMLALWVAHRVAATPAAAAGSSQCSNTRL